ncbi:MAG: hypothetical protein NZL83_00200 [Candidatus Absconditabacterales bacterium]|nr:hypothetical protein [Candidatus Absconditabacterales bacterium]
MLILSPGSSVEQRKPDEQRFGQNDLVDVLAQEGISFGVEEDEELLANKSSGCGGTRSGSCSASKCRFTE